ncbi:hypothetical protein DVDV_4350 [Desulfovibrio sp. DV]|nr:hypothetical protein DVDV_4350 [Desulfovibrio sp. DV]
MQAGFLPQPQRLVGSHGVSQLLHKDQYPSIPEPGELV